MQPDAANMIFSPVVQGGALGLCCVLLAMLFWLIKQLLNLLTKTNEIIAANTGAIQKVAENTADAHGTMRDVRDRLLQRRCLLERD